MMQEYYLAIDIGASGGRHILGHLAEGKLVIEEIYRFENQMMSKDDHLFWDTEFIFREICEGLKQCKALNKIPKSVGIDTWGVDYVLLDQSKELCGKTYAYRDQRTQDMDRQLAVYFTEEELYKRTGLQKQPFNTVYQLLALKKQEPEVLDKASYFMMMPDYFHFLLSGVISNEYTNASTTQLLDVKAKDWDRELIDKLGIDINLFGPLSLPGKRIGRLREEVIKVVGFDCEVVLPATHDTGSAFMAVSAQNDDSVYLSSGTWSLMGCELSEPLTNEESRLLNYTNEGGYDYRYRFLKNIMGLWMIQSVRNELPEKLSFEQLSLAGRQSKIKSVLNCNDSRFLAPDSMIRVIKEYCREENQEVPETTGDLAAVIYKSLAAYYKRTYEELSLLTGKNFDCLQIVGGGCQNEYLNQLTADALGIPVLAGPVEATAIGNIMAQMIQDKVFRSLKEARLCVNASFAIKSFKRNENTGGQ